MAHHHHPAHKHVILVTGATGAQGGSVVAHLLRDGHFTVRALTRDTTSAKAAAFAKQHAGVELVKGDLHDAKSVIAASAGAFGMFIVTQFWEKLDEDDEVLQGKNAIDAAVHNKLQHVVFSGLAGVNTLTNGRIRVPHFDGKWRLCLLLRASGLSHSVVFVPAYYENYLGMLAPQPGKDNKNEYTFTLPAGGKRFPQGAVSDVGGYVVPLFKEHEKYNGKVVDAWTTLQTLSEVAAAYASSTGRAVKVAEPSVADFSKFPFPGAKEIADMFHWYQVQDDLRKAGGDNVNLYRELGIRDADFIAGARTLYPAAIDLPAFLRASPIARPN